MNELFVILVYAWLFLTVLLCPFLYAMLMVLLVHDWWKRHHG